MPEGHAPIHRRRAHEAGGFSEAVLLCAEALHAVDAIQTHQVCGVRERVGGCLCHAQIASGCPTPSPPPPLNSVRLRHRPLQCSLLPTQIAAELRLSVQRCYYDTAQRMDAALRTECGGFSGERYSKVRLQIGMHRHV